MSKPELYASVWEAIEDTQEQAANLRSRAELMQDRCTSETAWLDTSRGRQPLWCHPASDQRSAPRTRIPVLTRRSCEHCDGAGVSRAFRSRSRLSHSVSWRSRATRSQITPTAEAAPPAARLRRGNGSDRVMARLSAKGLGPPSKR